ncbi:MAG TPA: glycosyltransferase family 1 protein [Thermoanaerobaculia bacterium]|nr:glycosyltransferase family 1 protein [Thermoanaerobaculia bacterium]
MIVQIVPHLPPPDEGVGSFALVLADLLRARWALESRFLVASPSWSAGPEVEGTAAAARLPAAEPGTLRRAIEEAAGDRQATVLLHYAGYGYHPRGCPAWLVEELKQWTARDGRRLVTVFHEVYATGPPWRSSFWLSPVQRRLAGILARHSAGLVTSLGIYRRNLLRRAPGREVRVLPVFSTVGEPSAVPPLADRARRLVLFGGPGIRGRAYRWLAAPLAETCRALGIEEICDVGPPVADRPDRIDGVPVRSLGILPAAEVSGLLRESLAGFVAYPAPFLAKSTVFAAYCAHGMLPVSAWHRRRREFDPPPPCWRPVSGRLGDPQAVAGRARAWYAGHCLDRHAEAYRELLLP